MAFHVDPVFISSCSGYDPETDRLRNVVSTGFDPRTPVLLRPLAVIENRAVVICFEYMVG
jgi:hypothetical protein